MNSKFYSHFLRRFVIVTKATFMLSTAVFLNSAVEAQTNFDKLVFTSPTQKLDIAFTFDAAKRKYIAKYELLDLKNQSLNKGEYTGCTFTDKVTSVSEYLKKEEYIKVYPLEHGFAVQTLVGCGGQSVWWSNVVTPLCTAAVPSTDQSGRAISIGKDADKIMFGYLEGYGASRRVKHAYLTLDDKGMILNSNAKPIHDRHLPIVNCKK